MDPLTAIVTSEARARVLSALFAQPPRAYYQRELARETGLPLLAVQRELRRLVSADLVRERLAAGRRVYEANDRASIFHELLVIVMKVRGLVPRLEQALRPARQIELAWIFGSFATGTATAVSDVDLMVVGPILPRRIRALLIAMERELTRSINEHVISAHEWSARLAEGDPFVTEVRNGPKLWLIGDDDSLRHRDRVQAG